MGRAYGTPRHLRRSCGRRRDSSRSSVPNRLVRTDPAGEARWKTRSGTVG